MKKMHLPRNGYTSGLQGLALCGRWAHYATGDRAHLRDNALAAKRSGQTAHYCARCLKEVK